MGEILIQDIMFTTERLKVAHWATDFSTKPKKSALENELKTILTPAVLCHLPEPLHLSSGQNATADWIEERASESDVLSVRDGETTQLLGLIILVEISEVGEMACVHLGYLLGEYAWGKGYGSEMLAGLIQWYRGQSRTLQLVGGVGVANIASASVLLKNRFEKNQQLSDPSTDMFSLLI